MAMNYSSCTVRAAEDEFASAMRHGVDWKYDGGCKCGEEGGSGGIDTGGGDDLLSRLPSDPFGMEELSSTFSAALAGWISDFGTVPRRRDDDDFDAEMDYYWNQALACEDGEQRYGYGYNCWVEAEIPGLTFPSLDEIPGWFSYSWVKRDFLALSGNGVSYVAECSSSGRKVDDGRHAPHEGLLFALGYLDLKDLLSVERVCKSLRSAVVNDTLLWRCIHVDAPLSQRITDTDLLRLTQRAQGSLECLSLPECTKITDQGLMSVLQSNPRLKKLGIDGCIKLTVDGLISSLKIFTSLGGSRISYLKLGRLFSVSPENYEELKSLVDREELSRSRKPWFYHQKLNRCDDGRWMDIEFCPICQKFKLVFDCPLESCRDKDHGQCRGCEICIARCVQCGRCIENCRYVETFCLQYLCGDCWKSSPLTPERRE